MTHLEGAVSLEESDGSLSEAILDMLRQFAGSGVWIHEWSVCFHQKFIQGNDPVLQDLPDPVLRLVLPEVSSETDIAAKLQVFLSLFSGPSEAVNHAGRQSEGFSVRRRELRLRYNLPL